MEKRRYVSCTGDIRDAGSIPGLERSPGGQRGNHSSLLPGESHGRRSLVGHSPQGHTESDSTEATWHAGAPRPPWPSLSSWVNVSLALYSIVVGFVAGWCPQLVRCHHGHGVVLPLAACCGLAFQALWRCCSPLPSSCSSWASTATPRLLQPRRYHQPPNLPLQPSLSLLSSRGPSWPSFRHLKLNSPQNVSSLSHLLLLVSSPTQGVAPPSIPPDSPGSVTALSLSSCMTWGLSFLIYKME